MKIRKRPYQFPAESRCCMSKESAEVLALKIPPRAGSKLAKGIYFVRVGQKVGKFVRE